METANVAEQILSFMTKEQKAALFLSVGGGLAIGLLIVGLMYRKAAIVASQ